ncbi:MAG: WYL domain-containing protein [Aurantimicrobium sp.]
MAASRLEAADRVTLLMAFVPYLIDQGAVPVDQLAVHFDITPAQVQELVQLLAMSGVPGDNGFYQHQDLFDINWDLFEEEQIVELWQHVAVEATPRFSAREAAALLAGLQYISAIVPDKDKSVIEQLVSKIALGASAAPENLLVTPAVSPVDLGVIRQAVAAGLSVHFSYQNATGERLSRTVDPLRLDLVGESWYLRGWSHEREALRTFRLDRISDLSISTQQITTTLTHGDLPDELFDISDSHIRVSCVVEESSLPLISAYRPVVMSAAEGDTVQIEVAFSDLSSVPVFVSQLPGAIRVVSPPEAVSAVSRWAQQALTGYNA